MTDQEYLALLAKAASYQEMSDEDKAQIAAASGEERAAYVKMFQAEVDLLTQANEEFVKQNEEAVNVYKTAVKRDQSAQLKQEEKQITQAEMDNAEDLLKQI